MQLGFIDLVGFCFVVVVVVVVLFICLFVLNLLSVGCFVLVTKLHDINTAFPFILKSLSFISFLFSLLFIFYFSFSAKSNASHRESNE